MIVHKRPFDPEAHAVGTGDLAPASALLAGAMQVWLTCHGGSGSIGLYQATEVLPAVGDMEAEG